MRAPTSSAPADLQSAWCDPSVAAVLCARGGSGAARLVDRLDWTAMREAGPKVLVGFSDVTVLHEAVAHHLGLASLFGPMPASAVFAGETPDAATVEHLRRTLFEPQSVRVLSDPGTTCHVAGRATGITHGGTLALLANTIGTRESRPAAGAIVVLEDVAEPAFRLDSMLTQLLRTGWFDGVAGIVLGSWTDCGPGAVETVVERLEVLGRAAGVRPAVRSRRAGADRAAGGRGDAGRRRGDADPAPAGPALTYLLSG